MSGMLSPGDRLVAIDGIEIGTAPAGESPQLPGPHGSPVTLTFHRAANGRAFYEGCEVFTFNVNLTRSRDFFPDKLTQQAQLQQPPQMPTATKAPTFSDESFAMYGAPMHVNSEQESRLVDDILKSLGSPSTGEGKAEGWSPEAYTLSPPPRSQGSGVEMSSSPKMNDEMRSLYGQLKAIQQNLVTANDKIRLLEDQLDRERDQATSVQTSQEASIRSLVEQQNKTTELVAELRQFIETQSEQLKNARRGEAETEEEKRKMDEYTEKTSAALRALNTDLLEARRERDLLRDALQATTLEMEGALKEIKEKKHAEQAASESKQREELMKKKAESLAKEIVRLRAEIKRSGNESVPAEPTKPMKQEKAANEDAKDKAAETNAKEQFLLEQILKLRDENKQLRGVSQNSDARSIGLHDTTTGSHTKPSPAKSNELNGSAEDRSIVVERERKVATASSSPSPPALSHAKEPSVKLDLELNMPFSEALVDEHAFCVQLRTDVAKALEGDAAKVQVLRLQPGSVIATLQLDPGVRSDGSTPLDSARALADQAVDPRSLLRQGLLTSFTTSVRSIVVVKDGTKEILRAQSPARTPPPAILEVSVGKGRNIPVRDGMMHSFIVVRVNDIGLNNLPAVHCLPLYFGACPLVKRILTNYRHARTTDMGITEQQPGAEPCFMQEFKSQVLVDHDTMISLSFHQQDSEGRHVLLGYVAVPLQRVLQSGREEGWYDLRSNKDGLVHGLDGIAEILVAMSVSSLPSSRLNQIDTPPAALSSIVRPKALLEVLVGRTRYVDVDGFPRKLVCTLHPGNAAEPGPMRSSRKSIGEYSSRSTECVVGRVRGGAKRACAS